MSVRTGEGGEAEDVTPPGWPRGSGYAHGMVARGKIVSVAGQVGWDPCSGKFEAQDLVGQTAQALKNVAAVLGAAGAAVTHVIRLTWYIVDRDAYVASRHAVGEVYRAVFGRHYPPMSVVVVSGLVEPEALVEIEATAVIPE